jgi:N-acetylmuramoyl-L-alanine amidase
VTARSFRNRAVGKCQFLQCQCARIFLLLGLLYACDAAAQKSDPAVPVTHDSCQKSTFRIALDVGHDKTRPGATSARGVTEFTYNLALAELVLHALKTDGFHATFLIGESGERLSLMHRTEIAREGNAALFISLHHDSVQPKYLSTWLFRGKTHLYSDKFHGYSIFVSGSSHFAPDSMVLATDLGQALIAQGMTPSMHHAEPIPGENRVLLNPALGIYRFDQLAVLSGATMPALLLESGIIVNRDEEHEILSGDYHPGVVMSLVNAIRRYCTQH